MITAQSQATPYQTLYTNGRHEALADVPPAKGGQDAGLGPHELIEAGLACCLSMWYRMQAQKLGLPLPTVVATVNLIRDHPEEAVFECEFELQGDLSKEQKRQLLEAGQVCPVQKTLSKRLRFVTRFKP